MSIREYSTESVGGALQLQGGEGRPGGPSGRDPAAVTLSTLHISPQDWPGVSWIGGASLLKVSKGGHCTAPEGGLRAQIQGFSDDSRRRLLRTIARVRRDAPLPMFVTLTWPEAFPSARDAKRFLDRFLKRLRREFPGVGLIWKLEPQQRGAPHFHMLVWGVALDPLRAFVPGAWFAIAGGGDVKHLLWHLGAFGNGNKHCVQKVRSWRGVWNYAAKYLGKTFEVSGWDRPGRYWAVVSRGNIPFGEEQYQEVSWHEAIQLQRYQRRFAHMKPHGRSLTILCDADQWVSRLVRRDDEQGI